MITDLTLKNIPYTASTPGENQTQIDWIKNGERVCGASTALSSDGTINRPTVQVQANAVTLQQNDAAVQEKVNEIIGVVNNINDSLDQIGDNTVLEMIHADNIRIQELERQDGLFETRVTSLEHDVSTIKTEIGSRESEDTGTRTIMGELYFQKKEMGSYPGFNIDGMPDIGNPGSGMKYRISQLSLALANYDQRISRLENEWTTSDVGELTAQIDQLRIELGPRNTSTGLNVYLRLNTLEQASAQYESDITAIKSKIAFNDPRSMNDRVSLTESICQDLKVRVTDPSDGLVHKVSMLESVVGDALTQGTLVAEMTDVKNEQTRIMGIVGETDSQGIRAQMASINTTIGTDEEPESIRGRLSIVEADTHSLNIDVSNIKAIVGDSSSGLVAASAQLGKDVYGDASAVEQLDKDGLKLAVSKLIAKDDTFITKAVQDGAYYVRNNVLVQMTDIYADVIKGTQVIDVAAEDTPYQIPLTGAETGVSNGIQCQDTITFNQRGTIKVDVQVYARVENPSFTQNVTVRHTTSNSDIKTYSTKITGTTSTHNCYTMTVLMIVGVGDQLSLEVQAANGTSLGNFNADEVHVVITPVI